MHARRGMADGMRERIARWDWRVSRAIAGYRRPWWTQPLLALTWSGATVVWIAVSGALLIARDRGVELVPMQTELLLAMLASLIALAIGGVLKRSFQRRRPFATEAGVELPSRIDAQPRPVYSRRPFD